MKKSTSEFDPRHLDLLYQALETEMGGVEIYQTALQCVRNPDLRAEWQRYLTQTEEHVRTVREVMAQLGLDPEVETPGRQVVRNLGKSLVKTMQLALGGDAGAAQIVAAECVLIAETKDHMNWELLGKIAPELPSDSRDALTAAQQHVEREEDEHYYHGMGWARELWLEALGLPAQLPPPEEEEDVRSAREAARVKDEREQQA